MWFRSNSISLFAAFLFVLSNVIHLLNSICHFFSIFSAFAVQCQTNIRKNTNRLKTRVCARLNRIYFSLLSCLSPLLGYLRFVIVVRTLYWQFDCHFDLFCVAEQRCSLETGWPRDRSTYRLVWNAFYFAPKTQNNVRFTRWDSPLRTQFCEMNRPIKFEWDRKH